jgi:hypothetical protein
MGSHPPETSQLTYVQGYQRECTSRLPTKLRLPALRSDRRQIGLSAQKERQPVRHEQLNLVDTWL